jgi:hypothetical protein
MEGGALDDEPALDVTVISPHGEIILEVRDERSNEICLYRVQVDRLRQSSAYFERLLHPDKFGEGKETAEALERLKKKYSKVTDAPHTELPRVKISDVGKISKVSTIKNLVADFSRALHGLDLLTPSPPLANLANLAIVADRFDALPHLAEYVRRHKYIQAIEGKSRVKTEEKARQKLLVGVLLNHGPWISPCSKQLIIQGSKCWDRDAEIDADAALWWSLPRGIEEEMMERREYVLETLESIQTHFMKLYSSNERQCKLGYDSSLQCDSFQLGEMVRFFTRANLLRWDGTLSSKEGTDSHSGDIERILDILRQCPSYQIDRNHAHCGLRTRLMPILEVIEPFMRLGSKANDIGICGDCWIERRAKYAWKDAKRPVGWSMMPLQLSAGRAVAPGSEACLLAHAKIRNMFMAAERHWTAQDVEGNGIESRVTLGYRRI